MKNFKGTKGKWEQITANWDLDQEVFVEDTEIIVAKVFGKPHEQRYNALLISKAPEMLEMLNKCFDMCDKLQFPTEQELNTIKLEIKQLIKEATEL